MTTREVIEEIRQMGASDVEEVLEAIAVEFGETREWCAENALYPKTDANVQAFGEAQLHVQQAVKWLKTRIGD